MSERFERFKLAANVLLKRRLNNLVRIDHLTEIDRNLITCAEYQLFIDEMRPQGKNRQPDHWTAEKFSDGEARKPITGVRKSDAEEFCAWLTERETLPEFSYRLPTLQEFKEITTVSQNIGCWCRDNASFIISGITAQQWQIWQQKLSEYFVFPDKNVVIDLDLDRDQNLDLYRNLYQNLYRNLDLDRDQNLDLYRNLYQNLYYNLDLYLYRNLYQNLYYNLDLYLYRNLYQNLYYNLDLYLYRNLYQNLYCNLDLYRNLDLDLDLYLYRNLYDEITVGTASNFLLLYFPLIAPISLYQSFNTIYAEAVRNRQLRQKLELSRQECQQKSREYTQKKDNIFQLYAYLVLMDQRQKGNMPAWEGIRIVRERKEV